MENDAVLVALTVGTSPVHEEEDEERWLAAVGMAVLNTRDLRLLSPGDGGNLWLGEVPNSIIWCIEDRQSHPHSAKLTGNSEDAYNH